MRARNGFGNRSYESRVVLLYVVPHGGRTILQGFLISVISLPRRKIQNVASASDGFLGLGDPVSDEVRQLIEKITGALKPDATNQVTQHFSQ